MNSKGDVTKWQMFFGVLLRALTYSVAEVVLLTVTVIMVVNDYQWTIFLWVTFVATALWVVIVSSDASEEMAKELVLLRELYITDFLMSAVLLAIIAVLVWPYGWQFAGMSLLATGQNLRYTYLSNGWLQEERRGKEE